jgi:hypothetical protein
MGTRTYHCCDMRLSKQSGHDPYGEEQRTVLSNLLIAPSFWRVSNTFSKRFLPVLVSFPNSPCFSVYFANNLHVEKVGMKSSAGTSEADLCLFRNSIVAKLECKVQWSAWHNSKISGLWFDSMCWDQKLWCLYCTYFHPSGHVQEVTRASHCGADQAR